MHATHRLLIAAVGLVTLAGAAALPAAGLPHLSPDPNVSLTLDLVPVGSYSTGIFDEGASEIVAFDAESRRLFVVNAHAVRVDVLDVADPTSPALIFSIDASAFGGSANSVAVRDGVVAVAIEAAVKQDAGLVAFFDVDSHFLSSVTVGALPDMLTFTPDGSKVVVANEGEPADYCSFGLANDPLGSVSVIDVTGGVASLTEANVTTVDFTVFDAAALDPRVRVYGPGASVAQDLEPEYVAVSPDSSKAFVTLQENNAVAVLDLAAKEFTSILPLGLKDHSLADNGLDASDKDGGIHVANWPVLGMYQPDAVAAYDVDGSTFLVTANEGDARDYECFAEEKRGAKMSLDPAAFPDAATLQINENLGRLTFTTATGDADGDGLFEELHVLGARSFSIWTATGDLVFDSGDALERITADAHPAFFNANNDENGEDTFESRSDNKGPEPEGVALGRVLGRTFAFVGLERIGGIVAYDVTDPEAPAFVTYANHRDFEAPIGEARDLGPEGVLFIPATESPNCRALLVVGNEVSGTTTIFEVRPTLVADHQRVPLAAPAALGACGAVAA